MLGAGLQVGWSPPPPPPHATSSAASDATIGLYGSIARPLSGRAMAIAFPRSWEDSQPPNFLWDKRCRRAHEHRQGKPVARIAAPLVLRKVADAIAVGIPRGVGRIIRVEAVRCLPAVVHAVAVGVAQVTGDRGTEVGPLQRRVRLVDAVAIQVERDSQKRLGQG